MGNFISKFNTTAELAAFSATTACIRPHVSLTKDDGKVHFFEDMRITAKYNVTSTSSSIRIASGTTGFSKIEIDGVELPTVVTAYTFSTTGEHTVKYTLTDPTTIGNYAFRECYSLTSIDIPNSVTTISDYAFQDCYGLTSCTIGSGVTSIGAGAFNYCSGLTSIDIPSGITSINTGAFRNCYHLTSIDIPSGVTSIDNYAFFSCTGLTSITCNATTPPTLSSTSAFDNTNNCPIYVPSGSVNAYKAATNWSSLASRIQAIP